MVKESRSLVTSPIGIYVNEHHPEPHVGLPDLSHECMGRGQLPCMVDRRPGQLQASVWMCVMETNPSVRSGLSLEEGSRSGRVCVFLPTAASCHLVPELKLLVAESRSGPAETPQ